MSEKGDKWYVHARRRTCWTEAAGIVRKQPLGEETPGKNTVEKQSDNNLEREGEIERDLIKPYHWERYIAPEFRFHTLCRSVGLLHVLVISSACYLKTTTIRFWHPIYRESEC